MSSALPRLLYVGDVPVEDSYQSSVQLQRLLRSYPPERLRIVETRAPVAQVERRLPGVHYDSLPLANPKWTRSPLAGPYRLWLTTAAARRASAVPRLIAGFNPEAVLTIASGFGWLVAAAVARSLGVPLHLIAHDDWPKPSGSDAALLSWRRGRFGRVYRQAQSRLCVSPFMIDVFEERYGMSGELLYPVRSPDRRTNAVTARTITDDEPVVIAFCGGSGSHVMPGLKTLGRAVDGRQARVVVFGPFNAARQAELHAHSKQFEFRGFVSDAEMFNGLGRADVLFAPMAFDDAARDNMTVSFPSKLVDYTAAGVPILIHGPSYCSAVRWAGRHQHVAHVVEVDDAVALGAAIETLKKDPAQRRRLAECGVQVGAQCFDFAVGRAVFEGALR